MEVGRKEVIDGAGAEAEADADAYAYAAQQAAVELELARKRCRFVIGRIEGLPAPTNIKRTLLKLVHSELTFLSRSSSAASSSTSSTPLTNIKRFALNCLPIHSHVISFYYNEIRNVSSESMKFQKQTNK